MLKFVSIHTQCKIRPTCTTMYVWRARKQRPIRKQIIVYNIYHLSVDDWLGSLKIQGHQCPKGYGRNLNISRCLVRSFSTNIILLQITSMETRLIFTVYECRRNCEFSSASGNIIATFYWGKEIRMSKTIGTTQRLISLLT